MAIAIAALAAALGVVFLLIIPAVVGPNFVSPFAFSEEDQVRRTVNSYFEAVKSMDVNNPQGEIANYLSPDIRQAIQSWFGQMSDYGIDGQGLWDAIVSRLNYTIDTVEIDGDTAVCTISMTLPDVNGISEDMVANGDIFGMSQDQIFERYIQEISDSSIPTVQQLDTINLIKRDGQWMLADDAGTPFLESVLS